MTPRPTMHDVSRLSGLSIFTVSRSLSGAAGVSDASRARVLAAADELGYVPNGTAQQLRRNTRTSIAVVTAGTSNNAYYLDLVRGIQKTVDDAGCRLIMADIAADGSYSRDAENSAVRDLIQSRLAGVISTLTLTRSNLKMLQEWDIPVVFVDSRPPEGSAFPGITTDNIDAASQLGDHLARHGYTSWLLLMYPPIWSSRLERERGIRLAAEAVGASLTVIETANNAVSALKALEQYVGDHELPRVIIAGNNPLALGAMRFLHERDIAIPGRVAVLAYDEFDWAPVVDPPLTVINEASGELGVLAARTLLAIIADQSERDSQGQATRPQYRAMDSKEARASLIVRRSCGCLEDERISSAKVSSSSEG